MLIAEVATLRMVWMGNGHCGRWRFAQIFTALHGFCNVRFCITDRNAVLNVKAGMNKTQKPHRIRVLCLFFLNHFFVFNLHNMC